MNQIIKTRKYKSGYEVRTELIDGADFGCPDFQIRSAYTEKGDYIGDPRIAGRLFKKFIYPEKKEPFDNICSIGFSEKEQKWYGWSHRAICGFGIGSTVKKGDCAYVPTDEIDFAESCLSFWADTKYHHGIHYEIVTKFDEEAKKDVRGVEIIWTYNNKVPNATLRNSISSIFTPFPEKFGRGEWTAETLDDARQMAIDFAESVG